MKVVFWQNMPSHIQSPGLREFSILWPDEVYGIWCDDIGFDRRQMGWQNPNFGPLKELFLPDDKKSNAAVELIGKFATDIHVFSGFHAYPPIVAAYRCAVRRGIQNLALMAEPGINIGIKGFFRPFRAKWIARKYIPHIKAFLAKGKHGVDFYRKAGFDPQVLYSYMYQSELHQNDTFKPVSDPINFIYAGKFIKRKGADIMIRAFIDCRNQNWKLSIIGNGQGVSELKRLAESGGIADRIQWMGAIPNTKVSALLSKHDVCLIPSRFEGWGVVTNEALQAGLAVICSDKTTSRELVEASGAGIIFHSGDSGDLANHIKYCVANPVFVSKMKERATNYRRKIVPKVIGQYLYDVLTFVFTNTGTKRPFPPWLDKSI